MPGRSNRSKSQGQEGHVLREAPQAEVEGVAGLGVDEHRQAVGLGRGPDHPAQTEFRIVQVAAQEKEYTRRVAHLDIRFLTDK